MKKKIFALLVAALSVCTVSAQVSFMGIPVDGTHGTKAYNSDGWYVSVRFDNLDNQPK